MVRLRMVSLPLGERPLEGAGLGAPLWEQPRTGAAQTTPRLCERAGPGRWIGRHHSWRERGLGTF